ncbi:transcription repressor OFP16-like [Miscanthus floridulus]|uniref:transcription repressor OFP16-like n=1 Tax=Miscanthus floridulus TaxID=154761 RepID=UPI0034574FB1
MEEEEEEGEGKSAKAAECKKNVTRLHRSFLHLSRALGKLHSRRGHAMANGETSLSSSSSAATSFLSGCMHPRTHSFASGRRNRHKHDDDGSGDALAVNFRSLRVGLAASAAAVDGDEGGSSSAQDCYGDRGSEAADEPKAVVRGSGVAVATLSAAPYEDFRRSMREMVDAAAGSDRGRSGAAAAVDWDFMDELLFCYLRLNDSTVHKDILRAFTDTVAAIRWRRRRAAKSRRTRRRRRRQPGAGGDGRGDCDGAEAVTSISS